MGSELMPIHCMEHQSLLVREMETFRKARTIMIRDKAMIRDILTTEYKAQKIKLSEFPMIWNVGLFDFTTVFDLTDGAIQVCDNDVNHYDIFVLNDSSTDELGGAKYIDDPECAGRVLDKYMWIIIQYDYKDENRVFDFYISDRVYKSRFLIEKIVDSLCEPVDEFEDGNK